VAAYEVLLLNTAIPQIQAAQSGDTYVVPRDIAFSAALTLSAGTANGVPYLNASKVLTTGSALTFDGTNLGLSNSAVATVVKIDGSGRYKQFEAYQSGTREFYVGYDSTSLIANITTDANRPIAFSVAGVEGMRLTSTGLGIGTNNPANKLTVSGATQYISVVNTTAGSSVSPSYAGIRFYGFAENANGLIASIDGGNSQTNDLAGVIRFSTQAAGGGGLTTRMLLDSSGNLGLGVTPSAWNTLTALQVKNSAYSATTTQNFITQNAYYATGWKYTSSSVSSQMYTMNASGNGEHAWFNAPSGTAGNTITFTQAMTLDASGRLLVKATSNTGTNTKLAVGSGLTSGNAVAYISTEDVNVDGVAISNWTGSATTNRVSLAFDSSGVGSFRIGMPGGVNAFQIYDSLAGAERARITSGGNLGLGFGGAFSALANLDILTGGQGGGIQLVRNATENPTSGQSLGSFAWKGADSANTNAASEAMIEAVAAENQTGSSAATNMLFYTKASGTGPGSAPTERARITSGGYFKASDTGTYSNAGLYHEFYQTGNNAGLLVRATNGSYTNDVLTINGDRATTNATYNLINAYNGPVSGQFIVRDSGNVVNTNGSYGTISDAKMKTDIVDAGSQWTDIKALRFRKFKMKNDPSGLVQLGVVAQEVELTSPGLVDEHADKDAEGNDLGTTTKSVKTSVLLMKAAVALQEAMARIEKLEAEVAALKGA